MIKLKNDSLTKGSMEIEHFYNTYFNKWNVFHTGGCRLKSCYCSSVTKHKCVN